MITSSPKTEIRWAMAGSAGREVFVVTVEEFLACGVSSHSETEFRGLLYKEHGPRGRHQTTQAARVDRGCGSIAMRFARRDGHTPSDHTAARSGGRGAFAPVIDGSYAGAAVHQRSGRSASGQTSGASGLTAQMRHSAFGQEQSL